MIDQTDLPSATFSSISTLAMFSSAQETTIATLLTTPLHSFIHELDPAFSPLIVSKSAKSSTPAAKAKNPQELIACLEGKSLAAPQDRIRYTDETENGLMDLFFPSGVIFLPSRNFRKVLPEVFSRRFLNAHPCRGF